MTVIVTVTGTVTVAVAFVICFLLFALLVVSTVFLSCSNMPKKWTDMFPFEVVAGLWAAKPRRGVQHKERKPRAKVSKEPGPMQNDNDGQDTEWGSLFDETGFQSQGSSDSLSTISSSNDSSSTDSSSDSSSGTDSNA